MIAEFDSPYPLQHHGSLAQFGRALVSKTKGWRFEAVTSRHGFAPLAQPAEQPLRKRQVTCSRQVRSSRLFNKEGGDRE